MVEIVSKNNAPVIGVAACVFKDAKILLGQRKKMPEINSWQCPGGLLQTDEPVFACAQRLVQFKTGLTIHRLNEGPYTNNQFSQPAFHSVTLYVSAEYSGGEINASAYQQAEDWQWFELDNLPTPLFLPVQLLHDQQLPWLKSIKG